MMECGVLLAVVAITAVASGKIFGIDGIFFGGIVLAFMAWACMFIGFARAVKEIPGSEEGE